MKPLNVRPITTDEEYQAALARITVLMDCEDELAVLSLVVAEYEKQHWPTSVGDPIAAIKFRMEQQGLKQCDLIQYIGSRSRVSEVLSRKRGLSLAMRRRLHRGLGIPAAVMLGE